MTDPGSVLIIEEPESHLYPALQVEFTHKQREAVQRKTCGQSLGEVLRR
ncbi:hypothetical protein FLM9_388 [Candidatus Synechococcus spongiarum]|uniref:Uncharacterized protein n=1 Tax=Candidatus Synechococcus spongiarum TaxID=431041 RepID=A0A165B215_9SYNE|nr:hypothetical protein FLM9_388 [Candidatus Synechococcus spongiarum]